MGSSKTAKHAERTHAVLSASSADRWLNCTPSALMCDKLPNPSSKYADEGTLAHELSEIALLHATGTINKDAYTKMIDSKKADENWYDGIMQDIEPYVTYVMELINLPDSVWELEKKTDLRAFVPDGFGTTDAKVISEGVLYVTDLKFGRGVRVSAVENSQLKLYAAGVLIEFDTLYEIHTIRLAIVQPRLDAISTWDITPEELLKWAEKHVRPTAKIAAKGEGKHKTGSWCQFCTAKIMCPAIKAEALSTAIEDFDPKRDKEAAEAQDLLMEYEEDLLNVYTMADRISNYLDAVKAHVYQRAVNGHKWPGLKLVEGRSNRRITDEEKALIKLTDNGFNFKDITNTKIKGIGDLEDLLGKKKFVEVLGKYIEKPKGKPTLVEESDRRPEITSANDFD